MSRIAITGGEKHFTGIGGKERAAETFYSHIMELAVD